MSDNINPLAHPVCLAVPASVDSQWSFHAPFVMWAVDVLRPSVVVDLTTPAGAAFATLSEAASGADERSLCLGPGEFLDSHGRRTIDLLHVDLTSETSRVDPEEWLARLSPTALVLLHGLSAPASSDVAAAWAQAVGEHRQITFAQGAGLAAVRVGTGLPAEIDALFASTKPQLTHVRDFFRLLGEHLVMQHQARAGARNDAEPSGARSEAEPAPGQLRQTTQLARLLALTDQQRRELESIHASLGFRIVKRYWAMREVVLPPGTRWGELYQKSKRRLDAMTTVDLKRPFLKARRSTRAPKRSRAALRWRRGSGR